MIVFFSDNINAHLGELNEEDSKHCYKVLRKKEGDKITVLDGKGGIHVCHIQQIEKNKVTFKVIETSNFAPDEYLPNIGISLLKNANRLEWFLEKATEIGVQSIQPLQCQRTLKGKFRIDRAEAIIKSATKQCMRPYLPAVCEVKTFSEIINSCSLEQKFICSYDETHDHLYDRLIPNLTSYILIGPEGDFHENELIKAKDHGWIPVNISNSRLRTETAAITTCQIVALKNRAN